VRVRGRHRALAIPVVATGDSDGRDGSRELRHCLKRSPQAWTHI
jgi:hypothetical protein